MRLFNTGRKSQTACTEKQKRKKGKFNHVSLLLAYYIIFCKKLLQKTINKNHLSKLDMLEYVEMIQDTWKLFPRLIEQKINGLLDEAEPNNAKAFQLYKTCKNENLWRNSFELFRLHLIDYFSLSKSERAKSYFDNFLDRPMSRYIHDSFSLTFRTAQINHHSLIETANWSHNVIKANYNACNEVISCDIFIKTLQYITEPPLYEKDHDIEFEDFCIAWKKTVFTVFGNKYDAELEMILKEIRWFNKIQKNPELQIEKTKFRPGIYLTQTEIDWTISVQDAVFDHRIAPKFPLSRGPDKVRLSNLERTVVLYNIIQNKNLPQLMQHLESVRNTILDQCGWLLREKAN